MIKPLFGVDITTDKDNTETHADIFFTAKKLPEETEKEIEECTAKLEVARRGLTLRPILGLIKKIALYFAIFSFIMMLTADKEADEAKLRLGILLAITLGGIAAWGVLSYTERRKKLSVLNDPDVKATAERVTALIFSAYSALGVPTYAYDTDVILFKYIEKDGRIKPKSPALSPISFFNAGVKVFLNEEYLSLSDSARRYDIPKSEIKHLYRVKKKVSLPSWNKETSFSEEPYLKHGLRVVNGLLQIKEYFILEIQHGGDSFGIYFPSYEIDTFKFLLNIQPEDMEE